MRRPAVVFKIDTFHAVHSASTDPTPTLCVSIRSPNFNTILCTATGLLAGLDHRSDNISKIPDYRSLSYIAQLSAIYYWLPEKLAVMDPFEVRMRFTSSLKHLNASQAAAHKTAQLAMKHKDMHEDLHSCILEQLSEVSPDSHR